MLFLNFWVLSNLFVCSFVWVCIIFLIKGSFLLVKSGECFIFATANVFGPVVQRIE